LKPTITKQRHARVKHKNYLITGQKLELAPIWEITVQNTLTKKKTVTEAQ